MSDLGDITKVVVGNAIYGTMKGSGGVQRWDNKAGLFFWGSFLVTGIILMTCVYINDADIAAQQNEEQKARAKMEESVKYYKAHPEVPRPAWW